MKQWIADLLLPGIDPGSKQIYMFVCFCDFISTNEYFFYNKPAKLVEMLNIWKIVDVFCSFNKSITKWCGYVKNWLTNMIFLNNYS